MLGVKTSCKDRWRQVLAEAERIKKKHLATLEPGISESQMIEMQSNNLQLVVPAEVQETYTDSQRKDLIDIESFIELVREKQTRKHG